MKIQLKQGLPFIEMAFFHKGRELKVANVLLDTGSASTLLSAEIAIEIGLGPEPTDLIRGVRGVGGTEFVYEKRIDCIVVDTVAIRDCKIQVGDMDYGFEIHAILGTDLLSSAKMMIDMDSLEIYAKPR